MKNINEKVVIIAVVIGIGLNLGLHLWFGNSMKKLSDSEVMLDALRQEETDLMKLEQSFDQYNQQIEKVSEVLLESELDVANFMEHLSDIATASGVLIVTRINGDKTESQVAGIKKIIMNMTVSGSYQGVTRFVEELSSLVYIVKPNIVKISRSRGEQTSLEATMELEIFTL